VRKAWARETDRSTVTIFGHIESTRRPPVKKLVHLATTFFLAVGSAAIVAYSLAHVAHYRLGVSGSVLREQALICAALIFGLVTIELLASKE
jgi:hypothetical protein